MTDTKITQGGLETVPLITTESESNAASSSSSIVSSAELPAFEQTMGVKYDKLFFKLLGMDEDASWWDFIKKIPKIVSELDEIIDAYRAFTKLMDKASEAENYFAQILSPTGTSVEDAFKVLTNADELDKFLSENENLDWQVSFDNVNWSELEKFEEVISDLKDTFLSSGNGKPDLFFCYAKPDNVWGENFAAQHLGTLGSWEGTKEIVSLAGKNIIEKVIQGSRDLNALLLNDDSAGDALFLDDMFSSSAITSFRLAMIDEIQAGSGDDIIDLTSQRFAYIFKDTGLTVKGGNGDDVIWANNGSNTLYGDKGNDRIIGGGNNDVIIGGAGDDSMHGGGGNDTFTFGANWGNDTVEQLANGSVTLWFANGSDANWNAQTLTYSDGINSVTVKGTDNVILKYGSVDTAVVNAFADYSSTKVYDKDNVLNMIV